MHQNTPCTTGVADACLPDLRQRVSLLYAATYLHYGFVAFLPVWLASTGSTPGEIGTLMAIPLILRLLTVAPFAGWCGRRGLVRNAIAITALGAAALAIGLWFAPGYSGRIAAVVAFSIVWDQLPVLTDAYAVMSVRRQSLDFGRLRVWGSIAVVASNATAGWMIGQFGIAMLPFLIAALLLLPPMVTPALPDDRRLMREPPEAGGGWRELFRDRVLMSALVAASLIMGSHGVLNSFGAIQWSSAGIASGWIGILNAIAVASEILAFVFGARLLGSRDPRWMIVLASAVAALRWAIMAGRPGLPVLVATQMLQGVSATGAILAPMLLIAARVPSRLASSAQGLNAVLLGAVLAAVTAGSGLLWRFGASAAYLSMAAVALLAPLVLTSAGNGASEAGGQRRVRHGNPAALPD